MNKIISPSIFKKRYATIFNGEKNWNKQNNIKKHNLYKWTKKSTYIKKPPFFDNIFNNHKKIENITK